MIGHVPAAAAGVSVCSKMLYFKQRLNNIVFYEAGAPTRP